MMVTLLFGVKTELPRLSPLMDEPVSVEYGGTLLCYTDFYVGRQLIGILSPPLKL